MRGILTEVIEGPFLHIETRAPQRNNTSTTYTENYRETGRGAGVYLGEPMNFLCYCDGLQYTLDMRISSGGGVILLHQIYSYVECQGN